MSLSVAGVWAVGVWDQTVWEDGVWREGDAAVVEAVTKGGSAAEIQAIKKKVAKRREERRVAREAAAKKADELFESIFGEDEPELNVDGKAVKVTGLPALPKFEHLQNIATIKDKVVREIAFLNNSAAIKEHNQKVQKFEEELHRLEEELLAVLVLTEGENIGTIDLSK